MPGIVCPAVLCVGSVAKCWWCVWCSICVLEWTCMVKFARALMRYIVQPPSRTYLLSFFSCSPHKRMNICGTSVHFSFGVVGWSPMHPDARLFNSGPMWLCCVRQSEIYFLPIHNAHNMCNSFSKGGVAPQSPASFPLFFFWYHTQPLRRSVSMFTADDSWG